MLIDKHSFLYKKTGIASCNPGNNYRSLLNPYPTLPTIAIRNPVFHSHQDVHLDWYCLVRTHQ